MGFSSFHSAITGYSVAFPNKFVKEYIPFLFYVQMNQIMYLYKSATISDTATSAASPLMVIRFSSWSVQCR